MYLAAETHLHTGEEFELQIFNKVVGLTMRGVM